MSESMKPSTMTLMKKMTNVWKKMRSKSYRDSYVSAHLSNTIAAQIFMLRDARNWTQEELAEATGMRQSRISKIEDPNYENIEISTLKRLASAFDVALTIRFIPFSELAEWVANLAPEKLAIADFKHDAIPSLQEKKIDPHATPKSVASQQPHFGGESASKAFYESATAHGRAGEIQMMMSLYSPTEHTAKTTSFDSPLNALVKASANEIAHETHSH